MFIVFFYLVLVSLAIQFVLFIPAFLLKTDKLTDLSYSLTFIILSLIMFLVSNRDFGKIALFVMISLWGIRLGYYLVKRIWKIGRDKRFDDVRINFWKFFSFWLFQGLVVPVILLPSIFFFSSETDLSLYLLLGTLIWISSFLTETIADIQKYNFINNPANKGKWVSGGLWSLVRHPNYLGEIGCWVGIYVFTFSSVLASERVIGFLSPLLIFTLLLFITGVPTLEKKADQKWGKNKDYRRYKKSTKVIFPCIY